MNDEMGRLKDDGNPHDEPFADEPALPKRPGGTMPVPRHDSLPELLELLPAASGVDESLFPVLDGEWDFALPVPVAEAARRKDAAKTGPDRKATERCSPAATGNSMTTNPPSDLRPDGATNTAVIPDPAASMRDPKSGTPKRVLIALACPPALVAVSVCHTALAVTYWIAFVSTMNSLYLSVASSYSVVALISLWKVHETFQKDRRPSRKPREMRSN
jgi:hypothetical protein